MQVKEIIEDIVLREVKPLCVTCRFADDCVYHQTATKVIIQCELFEFDLDQQHDEGGKGLCRTCDNAKHCKLPGRFQGVWHCNEFK